MGAPHRGSYLMGSAGERTKDDATGEQTRVLRNPELGRSRPLDHQLAD
jgi:hypothetical protein